MGPINGLSEHITGYERLLRSVKHERPMVKSKVKVLICGIVLFLPRVVAAAGAHRQFSVPFGPGFHTDGAIASGVFGRRRLITDGVLATNIVSDGAADFVHFLRIFRQKGNAASPFSDGLQRPAGAALLLFTKNPDGINGGAVFFFETANSLLKGLAAGVIFAVSHDENDLLLQFGKLLEMVGGCDQRVVQSSTATGLHFIQRVF